MGRGVDVEGVEGGEGRVGEGEAGGVEGGGHCEGVDEGGLIGWTVGFVYSKCSDYLSLEMKRVVVWGACFFSLRSPIA